ncbi:unnamed protein product, partial [Polarella glacialis]
LNTRRLLESLRRLPPGAARAAFLGVASAAPGAEAVTSLPAQRQFFARLREKRRQRLLQTKKLQSCHFWEADHVRAVADGGGEADLLGYQTLCVACHVEKSIAERRSRAAARRAKGRRWEEDETPKWLLA